MRMETDYLSTLETLSYEIGDCLSLSICPATQCNEVVRIDSVEHTSPLYTMGKFK